MKQALLHLLVSSITSTTIAAQTGVAEFMPGFGHACQRPGAVPSDADVERLVWVRCRNTDTVIVFVHGFNSNNRTAWLNANGTYWPFLLNADELFDRASVVLAPFHTKWTSGDHGLQDAGKELWNALTQTDRVLGRAVLDHRQIVFVAHSTGGVLARHVLAEYRASPQLQGKAFVMLLLGSPTEGSKVLANLKPLVGDLPNKMLNQLTPESEFLTNLSDRFKALLGEGDARRGWMLTGKEQAETRPIACADTTLWIGCMFDLTVVTKASATAHFGEEVPAPETNHFELAKPAGLSSKPHEALTRLYRSAVHGTERGALVPLPHFYSVTPLPPPATESPQAMQDPAADIAPPFEWTLAHGRCFDRDAAAAGGEECVRELDLTRFVAEGYSGITLVLCEVPEPGANERCSVSTAPHASKPLELLAVAWSREAGVRVVWDRSATPQVLPMTARQTPQVFRFNVRASPKVPAKPLIIAAPGLVTNLVRSQATAWFPVAERPGRPSLRFEVFPARRFDIVPGHESDEFKALFHLERDIQRPGQVRYRPR